VPNRSIQPSAFEQVLATGEPPHRRFARFALNITRVIGGRKFSTATATMACVVACTGSCQLSDFHFERTALFRSPRGQWFLAGEGGACSRWGRRASDGTRYPARACSSFPNQKHVSSWSSTTVLSKPFSKPRKADQ